MGHRLSRHVPVLLAILLGACDGGAPTDTFELSGRVSVLLDTSEEGGPIEGATVTFTSDTLLTTEATTDGDGRYRMRVLTDHPFGQVRASAAGFRDHENTVYFDGPQRRVDIELRRAVDP
ncbi:MAG: carboxypeptidase regulatory-like domain-containing protein [Sandaracinaceae bacterium]|nr:carboxypeptidase regulatory-like domain-containing protein [Sandaracinaceae bacterium]